VIYGLKQASHQWNLQFHGVLTGLSFKRTYADAGIYVCHQQEGDGPLFVILYVDDITILGASLQAVQRLKSDLSTRYKMSDLGEIESYLGICIMCDRSHKRLEIDQSGYLSDVLERFGMADASPYNTPLPTGADEHLKKFDGQAPLILSTISPSLGVCYICRLVCDLIFRLLCQDWRNMQQILPPNI
jgi:hypothetical protein